ncbi:methylated-DNA-protein-cysteine methyltransferase-like protein [Parabacteroides sp. PFB2-10]|uniref:MGMT family protein n=1 Tax=Parabacteroides sp. PFB2-10 TaxID=1742405 RepID=UPI002473E5DD|nr:MGMT family protein [Parabacteroides sp. PFB2-10]MDH6311999.1 methylated-DNA-protein-cysteine methyltransferase-like protein [Parabacteroides sp. PFB2-10]MDL2245281.1 MGMT family protein [Parabacteroides sp. OttesenSCG-928-J18]
MIQDKEAIRQAVYEIVRTIPYGRATSYGAIARAIGYPNMSRLVGKIMASCESNTNDIPAHRVVNSQGILSGKEAFGSAGEMQQLLEAEGIAVANKNRIQAWKTVFWNPIEEITL